MIIQGSNLPLYFSNIPVALDTIDDISILLCAEKGICLKHWGRDDITISEGGILAPITQAESMRFPEGRVYAEINPAWPSRDLSQVYTYPNDMTAHHFPENSHRP